MNGDRAAEDQDFTDTPTENEICTAAEIGLHAFWRLRYSLFTEGSKQEALAHLELESRKKCDVMLWGRLVNPYYLYWNPSL